MTSVSLHEVPVVVEGKDCLHSSWSEMSTGYTVFVAFIAGSQLRTTASRRRWSTSFCMNVCGCQLAIGAAWRWTKIGGCRTSSSSC